MKVYGYARVSTFDQANEGSSLETQKRQIEGYAMLKGWDLAGIFVEAGVSGSMPLAHRAEGVRLLSSVAKGDVIITAKLDRMFRNASDALGTLEVLKGDGVSLHMIDLGGDVCQNGVSKLVFTILSAVAESERDRIRDRIREVKRHLREQGVYNGGSRPFGYDIEGDKLVPNEAEQATLTEMKRMRAAGDSFATIGLAIGKPPMSVKRILDRLVGC